MLGWGLVAVLVVNLIGMVGAAWYYSGRIDSDALAVNQPGPWPRTMVVQAVDQSAGTITVTAPPGTEADAADALAELTHPFVTGLYWEGGFAQTHGTPTTAAAGTVTRQVTVLEGTLPAVGAEIGTHTFAFPQGPRPPQTQVSFPGPTGTLTAYLSRPDGDPTASGRETTIPEGTWAIMVHGKGSEPDEFDRMTPTLLAAGIPALAIEYRGDPGQPPATNGRYGFGATEWPDLEAAIGWAQGQGARHVVLVGASMGGAIVASYLRHAKDTSVVWKVVLDSPALHLQRVVEWGADQIALPGGLTLPAPVTWGAERLATLRTGLDWAEEDYLSDSSWDRVPTLVFHGGQDLTVPVTISRDLAAARGNVNYLEVPAADHVESWNVDPRAYESRLAAFLAAP